MWRRLGPHRTCPPGTLPLMTPIAMIKWTTGCACVVGSQMLCRPMFACKHGDCDFGVTHLRSLVHNRMALCLLLHTYDISCERKATEWRNTRAHGAELAFLP
jgi:hypothetical protein